MGALFEPFTPSLASSPFFNGIATAPAIPASHQWIAVRQRFEQFHGNLFLTPLQLEDAQTKRGRCGKLSQPTLSRFTVRN